MKITAINYNLSLNSQRKSIDFISAREDNSFNSGNTVAPTSFSSLMPVRIFGKKSDKIFSKIKNFSIDEYNNLSESEKRFLRLRYFSEIGKLKFNRTAEIIHDEAANEIKSSLDKKYGDGEYTVVTIGRSASSIGKVLGFKIGEDRVVNIPMSSASRFNFIDERKAETFSHEKLRPIYEFLNKNGIINKLKSSPEHKIVLIDYCCSGNSLKGAATLLKEDVLPQYSDRLFTESLLPLIPDKNLCRNVADNLTNERYKKFSFVTKCEKLVDINNSVKDTSSVSDEVKLFWFKLLDNFMTGKKHNLADLEDLTNKEIICRL